MEVPIKRGSHMAETNNGKGTTKLKTAEQHNAARRAAKAKQRRNRHHSQVGEITATKATQRVESETLDKTQAEGARRMLAETKLTPGSLAHRVAVDIIDGFPYARREGDRSKTSVAVAMVCRRLSAADRKRKKAVQLGVDTAKMALREAGQLVYGDGLVYQTGSASR